MSDQPFQQDGRWMARRIGDDGQEFLTEVPAPGEAPPAPVVIEIRPRATGDGGLGSGSGGGVGAGRGRGAPQGVQVAGGDDDLTASFLQQREAIEDRQAAERLRRIIEGGVGAAGDTPTPAPQPTSAAGRTDRSTVMGPAIDAAASGVRIAGDVATQLLVAAPLGAVREMFRAADDIGNWLTGQQAPAEGQASLAANPGRAIADVIPQGPQPATGAGRFARDVGQFLAGFVGGTRAIRGVRAVAGGGRAAAPATRAGRVAEGMTAGAIADFFASDPNRDRLADLWREGGLPENALTEYLASDDDDDQAERRLKNAIEGTVIGAAVEGLIAAARGFRAYRRAQAQQQSQALATQQAAEAQATRVAEADTALVARAQELLGGAGPDAPLVRRGPPSVDTGVPDAVAARGVAEAAGEGAPASVANTPAIRSATDPGPVFFNWSRISTPEDVQRAMDETAQAFRGEINDAGRGVQGHEATRELASALRLTPEQLLARERGDAWNAETIFAAREMLNASTAQLLELARAAAAPNATLADGYAFRRMLATHAAIQANVLGARREAGRALNAWGIVAGENREMAAAIRDLVDNNGGMQTAQAMAERLLLAGNDPAMVATIARGGWGARSLDAFREAWVNMLLSNPGTHLANITSNSLTMAASVIERSVAARIGTTVEQGEASEMLRAMIGATGDAFRYAYMSMRDGTTPMGRTVNVKVDAPVSRSISAEAMGMDPGSTMGRAMDLLGAAVNSPSRAIQAEDVFFQTFHYRAELRAQALRMARQEMDLAGGMVRGSPQYDAAVTARMQELIDQPPEALRLLSAEGALYHTLNRSTWGTVEGGGVGSMGQVSRGLQELRNRVELFGFIMPFIRTPMNAFSYGMERSPLAPIVGQWRADIAAGGARRDLALARMSLGSTAMLVAFDFADRGLITGNGPDDPGERQVWQQLGIQPYSVRVGDAWVQYNRLDPVGFLFAFSANMAEFARRREIELREVDQGQELMAAAIAGIGLPLLNRSSMMGLAGVFDAVSRSEMSSQGFANQFAGSLVPGVVAATERAIDPANSQVMGAYDAILSRIPGLSDRVPPRRNLWGEVQVPEHPAVVLANAFGPARISPERGGPIDEEMARLNMNPQRMRVQQDFGGALGGGTAPVDLRAFPEVYDRLVVLAGNEWRDPASGMGLRDRLNAMVSGTGPEAGLYRMMQDGRDFGRGALIAQIIEQHRAGARIALLQDPAFAEFREFVIARHREEMTRVAPPGVAIPQLR